MKIAILTSGILPVPATRGGAVENLIDFYLEYNNQYHLHDITIYSVDDEEAMHHPALHSDVNHYHFVDVRSFGAKIRKNFRHLLNREDYYHYTIEYYFEQALKHITEHQYDMVIIENRPGYGLKIPQKYPAKIVYHIHNDFLNAEVKQAQEIYDRANGIITVSEYIRQRVLTIDNVDKKSKVVLNGIDLHAFTKSPEKTVNRQDYGLKEDDFVIVFAGRIVPEKGVRELLEALQELQDYPDIKLLMIGGSFYGNELEETMFIKELRTQFANMQDRIVFTGFKPYQEIPAHLALADIAVLPSIWNEPLGLTSIEAMATGLPVITTDRGGISETVTPECAILLNGNKLQPSQISKAVLDLYHHPEKREIMGKAAQERSLLFSKDRYAKEFFDTIASF
ncbi:MAG: glycosyltransferase family 4 protein [Prevotella sp.]|nr:glycosyltransferase family 4 protein [Prevotella sp.]